jgi:hypothetical protein
MKKVTFSVCLGHDTIHFAQDIRENHGWFYELVDAAGVHFCRIIRTDTNVTELYMEEFKVIDFYEESLQWCKIY